MIANTNQYSHYLGYQEGPSSMLRVNKNNGTAVNPFAKGVLVSYPSHQTHEANEQQQILHQQMTMIANNQGDQPTEAAAFRDKT